MPLSSVYTLLKLSIVNETYSTKLVNLLILFQYIERHQMYSCISNGTRTQYFWLRTNGYWTFSTSDGNRFHLAQIICKNEPAQAMCARPCSWLLESPVGKELVKNWNIQNTPKVWLQLLVVSMLPQLYFLATRKVYQLTTGLLSYFTNGKLHFLNFP